MPFEEELKTLLLEKHKISDLLARALDNVPEGWALLWVQKELLRIGDPEKLRNFSKTRQDPEVPLPVDRFLPRQAESHLRYLRSLGGSYRFESEKSQQLVLFPPGPDGGDRRSFLTMLVKALVCEMLPDGKPMRATVLALSRAERREMLVRIARALFPFFPRERTTTAPKGLLKRRFDDVLKELRNESDRVI